MVPVEKYKQIKAIIQQTLELINFSGGTAEELSEEQMELVVAGVSTPEYQQFIQNIWKKRREAHGSEANH